MAVIDGAGDLHRARVDRQRRSIRTGGDMERKGNMSGTDQHKRDEWPNLEADPHTGAGAKAPDGNDTDTVKTQVGKATDTVRANEIFDDLRSGVASGLRELNEQLRRLAERLERSDDATATTDT